LQFRVETMPLRSVIVRAPASSANLGPGFDVFGLALEQPYDKVTLGSAPQGVKIHVSGLLAQTISEIPECNTAGIVASRMIEEFSLRTGVMVKVEKGVLPGRGLGSSAASAAGVAFGMDRLFDLRLSTEELIRFAAKGEAASAGSEHADNVSAAICGGFVIIRSYNPLQIVRLKAPLNLEVCLAIPHMKTPPNKTQKARSVVPKNVPLDKVLRNVGNAAALASGFALGDVDLIGQSMCDVIVEPERAFMIPGYREVKEKAFSAGACGVTISGAGPTMLAVVNKEKVESQKVLMAMKEGFRIVGLDSTVFVTIPGKGTCLMEA
jgi:homoserine kinase